MTIQTQTEREKVCKRCKTEGELKGRDLMCPDCRTPIRYKKSLSELPDGVYRFETLMAHDEIGRVPFARRFVFGHTEDGDSSKGLNETEENKEAYIKALKLLELPEKEDGRAYGDSKLAYEHCIWGEPLDEVKGLFDGNLIITGSVEDPEVYEKVIFAKLQGRDFEKQFERLERRKSLEEEIKDRED